MCVCVCVCMCMCVRVYECKRVHMLMFTNDSNDGLIH